jgi:hypothetical protein
MATKTVRDTQYYTTELRENLRNALRFSKSEPLDVAALNNAERHLKWASDILQELKENYIKEDISGKKLLSDFVEKAKSL